MTGTKGICGDQNSRAQIWEKRRVRFADIADVEATPRYDQKDKLAPSIELMDLSVHHSQGLVDSITAEMKAGKSEVACDAGQLVKISEDKDNIVRREALTKQRTDWAVDFDYQSRKEIIKMAKNFGTETELRMDADGRGPGVSEIRGPSSTSRS